MPLRQEVRFLRERAQRLRQMAEAHQTALSDQLQMMAYELEARADELERARVIENGGSSSPGIYLTLFIALHQFLLTADPGGNGRFPWHDAGSRQQNLAAAPRGSSDRRRTTVRDHPGTRSPAAACVRPAVWDGTPGACSTR